MEKPDKTPKPDTPKASQKRILRSHAPHARVPQPPHFFLKRRPPGS